ncbi:MAG: GUN4 domain-containing protein [Synechococcales bacterium]|nr:GUN4 domain-containing protein [Synechococcales bacterium]
MTQLMTPMMLSVLMIASSLVIPASVRAQSPLKSVVCHTTTPRGLDAKLTYRLVGSIPPPTSGMPQNPVGHSMQITVQQHHDNGQIKTLLKRALLTDYATIAPDADYSKLPFTGVFQAQPNNPQRLYRVSAASRGLYLSFRPLKGQPEQVQIAHYLSSGQLVRSQATCSASVAEKLMPLQTQLNTKNWAAADRETRRMFDPQSVELRSQDVSKPTPDMIYAIDQAWLEASDGRFGLTVQLRAWQIAQRKHPKDQEAAVNTLRGWLGWKLTKPRPASDPMNPVPDPTHSDWLNEAELNYSIKATTGHLPWVGVSDAVVQDVAVPDDGQSCGSCTIDAMALRSSRFYNHIPAYFKQIEAALKR